MKLTSYLLNAVIAASVVFVSCNDQSAKNEENNDENKSETPVIVEQPVTYSVDTVNMNGFIVYDSASTEKRPVVLVVHEWWGVNDYSRNRAKQLAEMGYVAMAVDMFGNGRTADNPTDAGNLALPFYKDPQMATNRLRAALNKVKELPQADASNVAAIGYCFGGSMVLNAAKLGEDYRGVVSFHGGLAGVQPDKATLKAKVLVCHGAADPFVPQAEVDHFKKQMDSVGADYTFKAYDSATHAFTNPRATEVGKKFNIPIAYNETADKQSWEDMKQFFNRIFPNKERK